MDVLETAMGIIAGAGDSRSYAMEAMQHARAGNFEEARKCINEAKTALVSTHEIQTELIQNEMSGVKTELTLLMVHAQDHLMSAVLVRELAEEIINLYQMQAKKEGQAG